VQAARKAHCIVNAARVMCVVSLWPSGKRSGGQWQNEAITALHLALPPCTLDHWTLAAFSFSLDFSVCLSVYVRIMSIRQKYRNVVDFKKNVEGDDF
jgi:hypothetical protein